MRALITGITGCIGSHLAEHLLACGDTVLGLVRSEASARQLPPNLSGVPLLTWDISQAERPADDQLHRLAAFAPDCVFHLAAISVARLCGDREPSEMAWNTNVVGTQRLLAVLRRQCPAARFLLASSATVYVPQRGLLVAEDAPTQAQTAYAATKLAAEAEVAKHVDEGWLDGIIVRSFQHAGPRQPPELMLSEWARQLLDPAVDSLTVHSCDIWLDLSDVRDACRAYRLLAQHGKRGSVYNVGSGSRQRTGDIAAAMVRLAGSNKPIVERYPGRRCSPIADTARLRNATGWFPSVPVERTVADSLAWWRNQMQVALQAGPTPRS